MKMYNMILDNGTEVTVVAKSISSAIAIAELTGSIVEDCTFIQNIDKLLVDESAGEDGAIQIAY